MEEGDEEFLESIREDFKCFTTEQLQQAVQQAKIDVQKELGKTRVYKFIHLIIVFLSRIISCVQNKQNQSFSKTL